MKEHEVLKFKAEAGIEPCWIVWEAASDGGRPYLVAVDTSSEQADAHVRAKRDEARLMDRPPPMIKIEESWLDHLYGESMTKSFDEAKKMAREVHRAQNVELRTALRRAIEVAGFAIKYNYDDDRAVQDALDELAKLERILPSP